MGDWADEAEDIAFREDAEMKILDPMNVSSKEDELNEISECIDFISLLIDIVLITPESSTFMMKIKSYLEEHKCCVEFRRECSSTVRENKDA